MRKPAVAGQFYSSDELKLTNQIDACFKNPLGSGMPRIELHNKKIIGGIVPHAGYEYSGPCAAHFYKEIVNSFPETFVILGTNHSGKGSNFSLSLEDFQTPLGIAKNDYDFSQALLKAAGLPESDTEEASFHSVDYEKEEEWLAHDEKAHANEHSVEVQIPFIQFIAKMSGKNFKIVPIIVSTTDLDECKKLGELIAAVSLELKRNVCIMASGDFTHYGENYRFVPFEKNVRNNLYALDRKSIDKIMKLDSEGFSKEAEKTTICGRGPIITCIEACKILGAHQARLLKYYTSGDVSKDYENAVGYASIVLE